MDIDTFNKGFKLFKRFLKEENVYMPVRKLMFKQGRKKESLFNEFNNKKYCDVDDWRVVFNRVNLLTAYMWPFNEQEFSNVIERNDLRTKWETYYNKNIKNYEI